MAISMRSFAESAGLEEDMRSVCDFLIRINEKTAVTPHYLWGRWAWQFGPYMNMEHVGCMGVAEEDGKIVGLAAYESDVGKVYLCADAEYPQVKARLIEHAAERMRADGRVRISLPDGDLEYQQAAIRMGFLPTGEKTAVARIDAVDLQYALPEGYRIISFAEPEFDAERYYEAIWRGFDNKRPRNARELESMARRDEFQALHYDRALRVIVVAPNGDYAAHCGMFCLPGSEYAYVEPVFTLPEYRRLGLGRAAVIEGVKRCAEIGAKCAYVGSSQQFYYSIGFYPFQNETWWEKRG